MRTKSYKSGKEANEVVNRFFREVQTLCDSLGLSAVVSMCVEVGNDDGHGTRTFFGSMRFGDNCRHETIAAYALGQCQNERLRRIGRLSDGAITDIDGAFEINDEQPPA